MFVLNKPHMELPARSGYPCSGGIAGSCSCGSERVIGVVGRAVCTGTSEKQWRAGCELC